MSRAIVRLSMCVAADAELCCRLLEDWPDWPRTFPLTIGHVDLLCSSSDSVRLQVIHKTEGPVVNILGKQKDGSVRLKEFKRRYDAEFIFFAEPTGSGSSFHVHACVWLKGALGWLGCLATPIIRSRIRKFLLEPLRVRAEEEEARSGASDGFPGCHSRAQGA